MQGQVFGHPRGLLYIAGTELWDRISFHGMQALLVLYMVEQLLLPGHVEHVVGFAPFRHAIESVTGPLSIQALAFQTEPSKEYMTRFRRDDASVSKLLTERDAQFGDYRERNDD